MVPFFKNSVLFAGFVGRLYIFAYMGLLGFQSIFYRVLTFRAVAGLLCVCALVLLPFVVLLWLLVDLWRLLAVVPRSVRMLCAVPVYPWQRFRLAWLHIWPAMGFYFALWVLLRLCPFSSVLGLVVLCCFWAWFPCRRPGFFWV